MNKSKYLILGAGLSGLTTAFTLQQRGISDFIMLEGRDRIGGRIHTKGGIDLGATWFQNHHAALSALVSELGIPKFRQYSKGNSVFVYSSMAPAQFFEQEESTTAYRIGGGSIAIIEALAEQVRDKILLNTTVTDIQVTDELIVKTDQGDFIAEKMILSLPPQLAACINYQPALPEVLESAMINTHTWMSNAIKAGISYKRPFWREQNLSGTLIGHVSPMVELYDHSSHTDEEFSLMGFVNEGLRDESPELRKERILAHLEKYLGPEVRNYTNYQEKDWSIDPYTACEKLKSIYISPRYGNPIFQQWYLNGKLWFSGAETSSIHGGYMDGAVISGINAAKKLF